MRADGVVDALPVREFAIELFISSEQGVTWSSVWPRLARSTAPLGL
jgi:hypothetical protein